MGWRTASMLAFAAVAALLCGAQARAQARARAQAVPPQQPPVGACGAGSASASERFCNTSLLPRERAAALAALLTPSEAAQLLTARRAPEGGVDRLGGACSGAAVRRRCCCAR